MSVIGSSSGGGGGGELRRNDVMHKRRLALSTEHGAVPE